MTTSARWVRPSTPASDPVWGNADGLQVGLAPMPGPRGLLRVYAPYLGHGRGRMVNYVAVEPVPVGATARGYSELERSGVDGLQGKRFRSTDDPRSAPAGRTGGGAAGPAPGVVRQVNGVEELAVAVDVEPFDNGAHVWVELVFRADRPYEVGLAATSHGDGVALDTCVLSATMGNYARLRRMHLVDEVVGPADLWPEFDGEHFTDHAVFGLDRLARDPSGAAVVEVTTDEPHDGTVRYAEGTAEHWRYEGVVAVQRWWAEDPHPSLRAQVNGRRTYWASTSTIPGGTSFENVELVEPFRDGRRVWFGVFPAT